MKITTEKNREKLEVLAGAELSRMIADRKENPILLLLAGGSALSFLDRVDPSVLGKNLTIGMFDERFSTEPAVNNFSQLMGTEFYKQAKASGASFLDSRPAAGELFEDFGKRIEAKLREWDAKNPTGKAIATFGVGDDGHTGGIMPFPENRELFKKLFESDSWYAAYDASGKNPFPLRASATMTFIREKIDARIIFAAGEGKRAALKRMLDEKGALAETPARIHLEEPEAMLFTDIEM